jgi:transcriptional regulator with XRE-family HTH domain
MKLDEYLRERDLTRAEFGGLIGRTGPTVSRIISGVQKPDWETLERIKEATGGVVMPNDFLSEDEIEAAPSETAVAQ